MSECNVIEPITITEAILTSSSVTEDDYDEWEEKVWSVDDYCILTAVPVGESCADEDLHKIYKCLEETGGQGAFPPDNLTGDTTGNERWELVGATNTWKMFDGRTRVSTTDTDEIEIVLAPGEYYNSLGLENIDCETIDIVMTDPTDGEVHNETISTVDISGITGYYEWFWFVPERKSKFVLTDLPMYPNATMTITFTATGETVTVGEVVPGMRRYIGQLLYGYSVGIRDYSTKTTDDDGNPTVTEGTYRDEVKFTLKLDHGTIYRIKKFLAANRATPLFWIGADWRDETKIYGIYDDLLATATTVNYEVATLSIWELS